MSNLCFIVIICGYLVYIIKRLSEISLAEEEDVEKWNQNIAEYIIGEKISQQYLDKYIKVIFQITIELLLWSIRQFIGYIIPIFIPIVFLIFSSDFIFIFSITISSNFTFYMETQVYSHFFILYSFFAFHLSSARSFIFKIQDIGR